MTQYYEIYFCRENGVWEATGLRTPSKAYAFKSATWYRRGAKARGETTKFKVVPVVEEE